MDFFWGNFVLDWNYRCWLWVYSQCSFLKFGSSPLSQKIQRLCTITTNLGSILSPSRRIRNKGFGFGFGLGFGFGDTTTLGFLFCPLTELWNCGTQRCYYYGRPVYEQELRSYTHLRSRSRRGFSMSMLGIQKWMFVIFCFSVFCSMAPRFLCSTVFIRQGLYAFLF